MSVTKPTVPDSTSALTDEQLVMALQQGDRQAFAELYDRYWADLFQLAARKLASPELAEELVQDLFITLWQRRETLAIAQVNRYLFSALKFSVIDHVRTQEVHERFVDHYLATTSPTTDRTSFWMKTAPDADRVDVDVITGKVSVFARNAVTDVPAAKHISRGVVLTPNQKVTVFGEDLWQTGLVAKPEPIKPDVPTAPATVLTFNDVPLPTVLGRLSEVYGIDLDLANAGLASCTFSGNISNLPLYTQLELICRAVGADYAVRGTRILISGRGCKN